MKSNDKPNNIIEVKDVTRVYGRGESQQKALDGVSFCVERGANLAIIGKSGSGKSTLMHAIAGLDRPSSGSIEVDGRSIWSLAKSDINKFRNQQIGFIFQTFYMQPSETVLKNVTLPAEIAGAPAKQRKQQALEALEELEMLDKADSRAVDLSGGQKQRVCIARAISTKPKILFADEPTGNLDSATGKKVEAILFKLNRKMGSTLIVVTHDDELAQKFSARLYLKDGLIEKIEGKGVSKCA